jgi:hypothetical protein
MKSSAQTSESVRKANDLAEIERLIGCYRSIAVILRKSGCEALERLAASWDTALPQLAQKLATSTDSQDYRLAKKGLRQGLKEVPEIIASKKGLDHAQLISLIETELNMRFADL